jgi:hypothetical protein
MARRGRARSTPSRTSPRRAPARQIHHRELGDTLPLTETLIYQYIPAIPAPVTIVQDSVPVRSKRKSRSQLTDEEWAKHLRLHPLKRDPITGQLLLGARARVALLKKDERIIVSRSTVRRRLELSSNYLILVNHSDTVSRG